MGTIRYQMGRADTGETFKNGNSSREFPFCVDEQLGFSVRVPAKPNKKCLE